MIMKTECRSRLNKAGFTLLEIIIVITIMGFLLAMIAPRLGNIGTSAVKTIDESNIKSMKEHIVAYLQQYARLPDKPVTIVNSAGGGGYQLPLIDNNDPDDGPETIGYELNERLKLQLHILNKEEAREIMRELGIRTMAVLNDYVGSTNEKYDKGGREESDLIEELKPQTFADGDAGRPFHLVNVDEGMGVLMIGGGSDDENGKIDLEVDTDDELGQPDWIYRIIVGIGLDSTLITKGMVQNAALSPKGMQNKDYNTFNYYCMVLPRLQATINRISLNEKEIQIISTMKRMRGRRKG
jgi:prepilin-type N-terminal cleavage/methylation domain-containing protein